LIRFWSTCCLRTYYYWRRLSSSKRRKTIYSWRISFPSWEIWINFP